MSQHGTVPVRNPSMPFKETINKSHGDDNNNTTTRLYRYRRGFPHVVVATTWTAAGVATALCFCADRSVAMESDPPLPCRHWVMFRWIPSDVLFRNVKESNGCNVEKRGNSHPERFQKKSDPRTWTDSCSDPKFRNKRRDDDRDWVPGGSHEFLLQQGVYSEPSHQNPKSLCCFGHGTIDRGGGYRTNVDEYCLGGTKMATGHVVLGNGRQQTI